MMASALPSGTVLDGEFVVCKIIDCKSFSMATRRLMNVSMDHVSLMLNGTVATSTRTEIYLYGI